MNAQFTITNKVDAITGIDSTRCCGTPPCPKSVKIELTSRCNFACRFCASAMKLRDKGDIDRIFYRQLLQELKSCGVQEIGLFYLGESFLVEWLPEAISEAKAAGFSYVFLTTNGVLATPKRVTDCMRAGLSSLKYSLNYADANQLKEVAGVNGRCFDIILENIKATRQVRDESGAQCGIFASYIAFDGEQGMRMKQVIEQVRPYLDEIYALPLYSQANITGQDNSERSWNVRAGNPGRLENMREPVPCWALFTEARITWDGFLSACCFDHHGRFHMGNLKERNFMDVWHSERFRELRSAHLRRNVAGTACEACVAYT